MIGRFASRLGHRLPGQLVAGLILFLAGVWFATDPLRHDYPEAGDLVAVEAEASDAIEIRKRRGAFLRFLVPDPLEVQAMLDPGERIVRYLDSMPRYGELVEALASGPAVFHLWEDAPDEENASLIWQLDAGGRTLVSAEETVRALESSRSEAARLPGGVALFGLAIVALSLRRRR